MSCNSMKKQKIRYIVAIIVMLFFVLNDLMFDFLFDFESSDYIAFACTLIAAIMVFYYNHKMKRDNVEKKFAEMSQFIKSSFDKWQVLFSILDIICGAISLLSGVAFIACIFKILKIGYVPVKTVVVINKEKSIIKGLSKISCLWISGKLLSNNKKISENEKEDTSMFKKFLSAVYTPIKNAALWIWANKKSILGTLAAIVSGVVTAISANAELIAGLPKIFLFGIDIVPYIAGLIIFGLAELGVSGKGFEAIKTFFARKQVEKENKAVADANKKQKIAEQKEAKKAEQEAKKQEEEDKKALELLAKKEAEEKAALEKIAEEERLLARAKELKAQQEIGQQKEEAKQNESIKQE